MNEQEMKKIIEKKKLLSLLGLAMKAGKLVSGTDRICDEVRRHGMPSDEGTGYSTCGIAVIAKDASDNTKKRVTNACKFYRVECFVSSLTMEEMSAQIGKAQAAACATFDRGFADGIRKATVKHSDKTSSKH